MALTNYSKPLRNMYRYSSIYYTLGSLLGTERNSIFEIAFRNLENIVYELIDHGINGHWLHDEVKRSKEVKGFRRYLPIRSS